MESALYGIYALVVFVLVRKYRTPWLSMKSFLLNNIIIASRGLRPGSKVCSEHMNDWRHLSLRDLVQREIFPPKNEGFLVPERLIVMFNYHVTSHVTKNWKRRKLANLLCLDKQIGISERGQTYLPFFFWNECTRSLKLKFWIIQD